MSEQERQTALEAKKAYMRDWRKANRQRIALYNQRYWLKKAMAETEQSEKR